jgi:hypothetical protein
VGAPSGPEPGFCSSGRLSWSPVRPHMLDFCEGLRLYWAPTNIHALRERLQSLGYVVSELTDGDYGQTEFFVTDDDGYSHCFGVATDKVARS